MRRDVLEVIAEEVAGRPVDALASFTTWDDGRRRLDGMAKGRRWDLDREHRAFERDTNREVRRLQKLRARRRKPAVYAAHSVAWDAAHREDRRLAARRRREKYRARVLAILKASRQRHKAKRNAEALAYYHAHRAERLAYNRDWDRRNRPREGKRCCSLCRQPGHNRRSCGR